MFKVGDILKIKMSEFEYQYGGCRGSTVYSELKKAAEEMEFEVIEVTQVTYKLKRSDGQVDEKSKSEVDKVLEKKQ